MRVGMIIVMKAVMMVAFDYNGVREPDSMG